MDRRQSPGWQFSTLFLVKDSLAVMLESAHLYEDALREYSELEACYLEALAAGGQLSQQPFGQLLACPSSQTTCWGDLVTLCGHRPDGAYRTCNGGSARRRAVACSL